jgi:hypothetical protein
LILDRIPKPIYKRDSKADSNRRSDLSIDLDDRIIPINGKLQVKQTKDALNESELKPLQTQKTPPPTLRRGISSNGYINENDDELNTEVSPSNVEARLNDAAAPNANLSTAALKTGSLKNLSVIGGFKVLPTENIQTKKKVIF